MSITDLKAGMQRLKITEKHIASRAGLDRRTVKSFLETGMTRSLATEQAIFTAYRELARERTSSVEIPEAHAAG